MKYTVDIKVETDDGSVTPERILERIRRGNLPGTPDYPIEGWGVGINGYWTDYVSEENGMRVTTNLTVEQKFGLGAVVEEVSGARHVKMSQHSWRSEHEGYIYSDGDIRSFIADGGKVLSDGIRD